LLAFADVLLTELINNSTARLGNVQYARAAIVLSFYRAMHFSAKRGIAIACRLSVRLSICL